MPRRCMAAVVDRLLRKQINSLKSIQDDCPCGPCHISTQRAGLFNFVGDLDSD